MSHYLFLNEGFEFICLSSVEDSGSFSRAGQKFGEGAGKNTLLQTFRTLSIVFYFHFVTALHRFNNGRLQKVQTNAFIYDRSDRSVYLTDKIFFTSVPF